MTAPAPIYDRNGVTLYQGDALEILPALAPADALITDPDYGVGIDFTKRGGVLGNRAKNIRGGTNHLPPDEADALLTAMLQSARLTRPQALVFWSGSEPRGDAFAAAVTRAGWRRAHRIIWHKPNGAGPTGSGLARHHEPCYWLTREGERIRRAGEWRMLPDVITIARIYPGVSEAVPHPTQKPVELMRRLVRFFSQPGETVLDPFAGSGTTLVAAAQLGRAAVGIEQNAEYCDLIVDRLRQGVLLVPRSEQPRLDGIA